MIIGKELLSEVLGADIVEITYIGKTLIGYTRESYTEENNIIRDRMNIFMIAHKCKEWAYNKNWIIKEYPFKVVLKNKRTGKKINFQYNDEDRKGNGFIPKYTFKACQWILENKD